MAMTAFYGQYGRRMADRIGNQDRIEAKQRTRGSSNIANDLAANFDAVSTSYEWERVERGEIDAATAMRLIKGREEGARVQREQKEKEKLEMR